MWRVEFTDKFETWWEGLTPDQQELLDQRVRLLAQQGPGLGRPAVDTLSSTTVANLKELRASTLRVIFAFDPRRTAILLLGGDKQGQWKAWYQEAIPAAERLYARHVAELAKEGE